MMAEEKYLRPLKALGDILDDYLAYLGMERGLSVNTLKGYGCDIRHFFEYPFKAQCSRLCLYKQYKGGRLKKQCLLQKELKKEKTA